jgi:hypothetical protein
VAAVAVSVLERSIPSPTPPAEQWRAKSADGAEFGPVDRRQLDAWADDGRITAKFQLLRVGDPQWQWATDVYPQLKADEIAPYAIDLPATPAAMSIGTSSAANAKYRAPFRPRAYPAMTIVMWVCYVLAGLFALSLVVSIVAIAMGASAGLSHISETNEISAVSFVMVMTMAMTTLGHGICILICVYAAEIVKVVLDIQRNTQEAAHYVRSTVEV